MSRFFAALFLALFCGATAADGIPPARDLQETAATAGPDKLYVILFGSLECPFCAEMRDLYLEPMLTDPNYRNRVVIREVEIGTEEPLVDFSGERTLPSFCARRFGIYLTPTLVFLDDKGEEMTEKMVGLGNADYFSYYLDQAIDQALDKIGKQNAQREKNISR